METDRALERAVENALDGAVEGAVEGAGRGAREGRAERTPHRGRVASVSGPASLSGRLRVPGDKSISHRALLLGALAEGTSRIRGLSDGDDVRRSAAAIAALGAEVASSPAGVVVRGGRRVLGEPSIPLDCGNSGTAIRLLCGLVSGIDGLSCLYGDVSVASRPMGRVVGPLREMGARIDGRAGGERAPLAVRGGELRGLTYELPVPSAQVKSALLLAGLFARGTTVVREPERTRAHTEEMLATMGARLRVEEEGAGRTIYLEAGDLAPIEVEVPGDPSQAAFFVVGATILPGSDLEIDPLYLGPERSGFLSVLGRMGAAIEVLPEGDRHYGRIRVRSSSLRATEVAPEEVPSLVDELPILAVAAAAARGRSRFRGLGELRVKETDRLATTVALLEAHGIRAAVDGDDLLVEGGTLRAGVVDAAGDHRIAMAAVIAGLATAPASRIVGVDAVATSYPGFLADLEAVTSGAEITVEAE